MDWTNKVSNALKHLDKPGRKLSPAEYREIIDDVVVGKLTAAMIAEKHGAQDLVMTALGHVTTAVQGGRTVRLLDDGGWYEFKGQDQPYAVAPGFAAAWKQARGLV